MNQKDRHRTLSYFKSGLRICGIIGSYIFSYYDIKMALGYFLLVFLLAEIIGLAEEWDDND